MKVATGATLVNWKKIFFKISSAEELKFGHVDYTIEKGKNNPWQFQFFTSGTYEKK